MCVPFWLGTFLNLVMSQLHYQLCGSVVTMRTSSKRFLPSCSVILYKLPVAKLLKSSQLPVAKLDCWNKLKNGSYQEFSNSHHPTLGYWIYSFIVTYVRYCSSIPQEDLVLVISHQHGWSLLSMLRVSSWPVWTSPWSVLNLLLQVLKDPIKHKLPHIIIHKENGQRIQLKLQKSRGLY